MSKFVKSAVILLGLLTITAIAFPIIGYQLEQPRQRELQAQFLNKSFAKVQSQNGKVLLVPGRFHMMTTETNEFFNQPMLFSVGSQLKVSDEHFGATYTITSIESDGVVIRFEAGGGPSSLVRSSGGTVKLAWK